MLVRLLSCPNSFPAMQKFNWAMSTWDRSLIPDRGLIRAVRARSDLAVVRAEACGTCNIHFDVLLAVAESESISKFCFFRFFRQLVDDKGQPIGDIDKERLVSALNKNRTLTSIGMRRAPEFSSIEREVCSALESAALRNRTLDVLWRHVALVARHSSAPHVRAVVTAMTEMGFRCAVQSFLQPAGFRHASIP